MKHYLVALLMLAACGRETPAPTPSTPLSAGYGQTAYDAPTAGMVAAIGAFFVCPMYQDGVPHVALNTTDGLRAVHFALGSVDLSLFAAGDYLSKNGDYVVFTILPNNTIQCVGP